MSKKQNKKNFKWKNIFLYFSIFGLFILLTFQYLIFWFSKKESEIPQALSSEIFDLFTKETPYSIRAKKITLKNIHTIECTDFQLFNNNDKFILVSAPTISFQLDFGSILNGSIFEHHAFANNVSIFCSPQSSVSGTTQKILENGRIYITLRGNNVYIRTIQGKLKNLRFLMSGNFYIPQLKEKSSSFSNTDKQKKSSQENDTTAKLIERNILQTFSYINYTAEKYSLFQDDLIELYISQKNNAEPLIFDINTYFKKIEIPNNRLILNNSIGSLKIALTPTFDNLSIYKNAQIETENITWASSDSLISNWDINISRAHLLFDLGKFNFPELPQFSLNYFLQTGKLILNTNQIVLNNFSEGSFYIDTTNSKIILSEFIENKKIELVTNVSLLQSDILANAKLDFTKNDFIGNFSLLPNITKISKIPQISKRIPTAIDTLHFSESPLLMGHFEILKNKFSSLDFSFRSKEILFKDFLFSSVFLQGRLTRNDLYLRTAKAVSPEFTANANVYTELNPTGKYRIQAWGSIFPEILDDYLGWFWWRIWKNLDIKRDGPAPRADIDVYGKWVYTPEEPWENVYGAICGENAIAGDTTFNHVELRIAETPKIITAFDMHIFKGDDFANGNLQWHYEKKPQYHYKNFQFKFDGKMPIKSVLYAIGENLPENLSFIESKGSATASVLGYFSGSPDYYPDEMLVKINGNLNSPFSVFGINGESFNGEIFYNSGNISINNFSAKTETGNIAGNLKIELPPKVELNGTKISFDLNLKDISDKSISELTQLTEFFNKKENDKNQTPASLKQTPNLQKKLSVNLKGGLTLPDLKTLNAVGNFHLYDPHLFELQFLGKLSSLLEHINFKFTSFHFDNAYSDWTIKNGVLNLPNLIIKDNNGRLSITANINLPTEEIKGHATFENIRWTDTPLIGKVVEIISSSTKIFNTFISGTIDNIEWTTNIELPFFSESKEEREKNISFDK